MWEQSQRNNAYGQETYRLQDRKGKTWILAPTHEEVATVVAKSLIESYRDLDLMLYQFGTKFRDEIRPRFNTIRAKEFEMMDAYTFSATEEDMMNTYETIKQKFSAIFNKMGLETRIVEADTGEIGGFKSEEFIVSTQWGDIEVGHIFALGQKYTKALNATYQTQDNRKEHLWMGCYGIGVSRLLSIL